MTLFNIAVSDRWRFASFEVPNGNFYQAYISERSDNKVLCISPLAFGGASYRISFIKIDAEGHEPKIIEALAQLIESDRPILMVECNGDYLRSWPRRHRYRFNDIPGSHNHILEPA